MKTTTMSSTAAACAGGEGRRDLAGYVVLVATTFALNAAVLLVGAGLTGFTWAELCFLVLPPLMAGSGAVLTFFVLNRMTLQAEPAPRRRPVKRPRPRREPGCLTWWAIGGTGPALLEGES